MDEHVVREAVALVDPVEVEQLEHRQAERGVAGLRVGDVPVARGDLREEREHGVAEVAVARNLLPRLAGEEPVRLRVVELAAGDGPGQRLELRRIHLVVAGHHGGHVDPLGQRPLVAGDDRGAHALVLLVDEHLDACVPGRAGALGGGVAGLVVHHEDAVDELGDARDGLRDQPLLVVRGHDDRDGLPLQHPAVRLQRGSAGLAGLSGSLSLTPKPCPHATGTTA